MSRRITTKKGKSQIIGRLSKQLMKNMTLTLAELIGRKAYAVQ